MTINDRSADWIIVTLLGVIILLSFTATIALEAAA